MRNGFWFTGLAATIGLLIAVAGCDLGSAVAKGTGKVTYKGAAIPAGEVNFFSKEKGMGGVTKIDTTGMFTLPEGLTPGQYAVYVTPPIPSPPPPGTPAQPQTPSPIPLKARDPATSGVTVALQGGSNDVVVELYD
jgi:hypothetical protein